MDMLGGHLVHEREMRHEGVHHCDRDVHPCRARVRLDALLAWQRERFEALPIRQRAKTGCGAQQIVQMRGARARQPRDDHRRQQFDVVDLGVARQQVG